MITLQLYQYILYRRNCVKLSYTVVKLIHATFCTLQSLHRGGRKQKALPGGRLQPLYKNHMGPPRIEGYISFFTANMMINKCILCEKRTSLILYKPKKNLCLSVLKWGFLLCYWESAGGVIISSTFIELYQGSCHLFECGKNIQNVQKQNVMCSHHNAFWDMNICIHYELSAVESF